MLNNKSKYQSFSSKLKYNFCYDQKDINIVKSSLSSLIPLSYKQSSSLCIIVIIFIIIYLSIVSLWSFDTKQIFVNNNNNTLSISIIRSNSIKHNTKQLLKPSFNNNSNLNNSNNNVSFIHPTIQAAVQLDTLKTFYLAESESNLPLLYWKKWNELPVEGNTNVRDARVNYCTQVNLTDPFRLRHNNLYWQVVSVKMDNHHQTSQSETDRIDLFLYNAYYDNRVKQTPVVVIITANNQDRLSRRLKWWQVD